ncbi:hypothetical protein ACSS6W_006832 [Trichoderma asperelloides]
MAISGSDERITVPFAKIHAQPVDLVSLRAGPRRVFWPLYVIDAAACAGVSHALWPGWQQRFSKVVYRRLRLAVIDTLISWPLSQ